jgi:hypothetical protein
LAREFSTTERLKSEFDALTFRIVCTFEYMNTF